jgi:hypothetical protein
LLLNRCMLIRVSNPWASRMEHRHDILAPRN